MHLRLEFHHFQTVMVSRTRANFASGRMGKRIDELSEGTGIESQILGAARERNRARDEDPAGYLSHLGPFTLRHR